MTFVILIVSYGALSVLDPGAAMINFVYANLLVTFAAVFALRGIYFALLEENRTPNFLTGAAVGLVSLVGYTPEVFFAPITGRILDANPGLVGFQNYFLFLTVISVIGVAVVLTLLRLRKGGQARMWPGIQASASDAIAK